MIAAILAANVIMQTNPACIPAINEGPTKAGDYDWMARHQAVLDWNKTHKSDLVFIGDSITHGFGGDPQAYPKWRGNAPDIWDKYFGPRNPVNLGFDWDQTQHVLWRIQNGELDGLSPKAIVIFIGTNNTGHHTSEQMYGGIVAVVDATRAKCPSAEIVLLSIFPRDAEVTENRKKNDRVNEALAKHRWGEKIKFIDMNPYFLLPESQKRKEECFSDYCHLTKAGYQVWADAIEPTLKEIWSK
ncbi:MAG: GDSL family lipase [Armatimonadetes bacterium]|nr:GDSL family lipase [Armatimonadota bacterium]